MNGRSIIGILATVFATVGMAAAQTTNFTPRAPLRSYERPARLHEVPLGVARVDEREASHAYMPNTAGGFNAPIVRKEQGPATAPTDNRTRDRQKDDEDDDIDEKAKLDVRTILIGPEEDRSIASAWNGLARDVLKKRAAHGQSTSNDGRKRSNGERGRTDDSDTEGGAGPQLTYRDRDNRSLWRGAPDAPGGSRTVRNVDPSRTADRRLAAAANPSGYPGDQTGGTGRDLSDLSPAAAPPPGFGTGGTAPGIGDAGLRAITPVRDAALATPPPGRTAFAAAWGEEGRQSLPAASPFGGGSLFAEPLAPPAGASLFGSADAGFQPGGGDAFTTPRAAPQAAAEAGGSADFKRPSALPW